jgi:hypothetical protein
LLSNIAIGNLFRRLPNVGWPNVVDGWWVGRWVEIKVVKWIAHSNQKAFGCIYFAGTKYI